MEVINVTADPDGKLKEVCKPVVDFGRELDSIVSHMFEAMNEHDGMGLASNQLGFNLRVFVMLTIGEPRKEIVFVNPEIVSASGKSREYEGCLSFRNHKEKTKLEFKIKRKARIKVKYQDLQGTFHSLYFTGFNAICVQHEIDHLDGLTMKNIWIKQGRKTKVKKINM